MHGCPSRCLPLRDGLSSAVSLPQLSGPGWAFNEGGVVGAEPSAPGAGWLTASLLRCLWSSFGYDGEASFVRSQGCWDVLVIVTLRGHFASISGEQRAAPIPPRRWIWVVAASG